MLGCESEATQDIGEGMEAGTLLGKLLLDRLAGVVRDSIPIVRLIKRAI